ncbi:unnamed protein product [Notodromas monacha]|uniref:Uncharacterized protein n=1 Tax=Notodromas monacha TaxID=399045 RepID=A0A7R9BVZ1_9CRUS|nr:unnamed protein product [Notodromas monacha]CAG0921126.1 unnamed protein product [Notodromas monacha]
MRELSFPDNLAQLGADNDWKSVEQAIEPGLRCLVTSAEAEELVDTVRLRVNKIEPVSAVPGAFAAIHFLLWSSSTAKDDAKLLKKLLWVGSDPDLASGGAAGWKPSHYCAAKGWINCLQALIDAGIDFEAESARPKETPVVVATRNKQVTALQLLNESKSVGKKSLAQLSSEQAWFAVLNRLRRRLVAFNDFVETVDGMTALQWAEFHKSTVAEEVRYWFMKFLPPCRTPLASEESEMLKHLRVLIEKQQQVMNDVVSRLIGLEAKFRALDVLSHGSSSSLSGEAVLALEGKLDSFETAVVERDAVLHANLARLQTQIEALSDKVFEK